MLFKVWKSELRKLSRSAVWIPVGLTPIITMMFVLIMMGKWNARKIQPDHAWQAVYSLVTGPYAMLLLPLLACAIAALVCRAEHISGGWKMLYALPVSRLTLYIAKFSIVLLLLALSQVLLLAGVLFDGFVLLHLTNAVPWSFVIKGLVGGWIAAIPLAALQFWVACAWESFGAQFAIATILTVPAAAVSHSVVYGPLYPWSQPILAMIPHSEGFLYISNEALMTIIVSAFAFVVGSMWYFVRRDIA